MYEQYDHSKNTSEVHDADDPGGARPVRPRQAVHQHAAAPRQPRLGEGEQRPEEAGEVPDIVADVTPPAADVEGVVTRDETVCH